jgi:hypothetical protein
MIGGGRNCFSPVREPVIVTFDGCKATATSGTEIDAAHDNAGGRAFELPRLEFA